MDIVTLFCDIADFCQTWEPQWQRQQVAGSGYLRQRQRASTLYLCEVMTIIVWFHVSGYRTFEEYYVGYVQRHLGWAFPRLVSYNRFVELQQAALMPLSAYLKQRMQRSACTGISFIDSTPLAVCDNRRIHSHHVFAGLAARGKSSTGWFYGFKLHLVINDEGELLNCCLTPGNVDDRVPVPKLVKRLWGKLFADKGYLSQPLFDTLFAHNLHLVTKVRKNMQNKLMPLLDKLLLRKRAIIETVTDQLKNISQVAHTRHRSPCNFLVNVVAGLIAYSWRQKKPSLRLRPQHFLLPALVL